MYSVCGINVGALMLTGIHWYKENLRHRILKIILKMFLKSEMVLVKEGHVLQ